ncbi:MAG TPA: phospholipase D-like domain-containing protein [Thermoanaerobaculia bacterium]|nr:phospholipase D-like domain-containing protein [Thermoanaerobaculia bacterium]
MPYCCEVANASQPLAPDEPRPQPERRLTWGALLRPRVGRRLPGNLQPRAIHRRVGALAEGLADPGFAALLGEIDGRAPYGGNRIRVFHRGAEAFAAIRQAVAGATTEILLESYIFSDDATGRSMLADLARAAAAGVSVRVLVDAYGSVSTGRKFWREMASHGIEVRKFHPLLPEFLRHPYRDHRKILVVDRTVAFTGGMNIADEYGSAGGGEGTIWRDAHVQVSGPAVQELTAVFAEGWYQARGGLLPLEPVAEDPAAPGSRVLVLDSRPNRGHIESAAVLAAIVAGARRRVWVTNAYFAPKRIAIEVLGRAAARGVDVRLLLPGKTDVAVVRHAGHGFFTDLLEQGVRIFEYQPSVLHAKSLVADCLVSVVGSTNLDFRSFTFNGECNLVVFDSEVAQDMERAFEEDLQTSVEIDLATWRRRPWLHRLGDAVLRRLAPLM